jgi:hypothetical protein
MPDRLIRNERTTSGFDAVPSCARQKSELARRDLTQSCPPRFCLSLVSSAVLTAPQHAAHCWSRGWHVNRRQKTCNQEGGHMLGESSRYTDRSPRY